MLKKLTSITLGILSLIIIISSCQQESNVRPTIFEPKSIEISHAGAKSMADETPLQVALKVHEDLEISLWASDSIVVDPVAISIDEKGRMYYTSGSRLTRSEFDIRGHRNWMTASISFETVEDRRNFLRKTFSETNDEGEKFLEDLNNDGSLDWKDLTVEKEQVWILSDSNDDGHADRSDLYIEDFNEEITDLANGVFHHHGEVFVSVGPDLWRTQDTDGDDRADEVESISHGYAVHIGFGAHGMSGVTVGPAGRIWWSIGDIGANVVDKTGKRWKYPNQGVVVRADRDGSNFEVFCAGVRNTHEFVFDKFGNLITEDNDGDHQGERERLVYLVDGSDSGWRANWQYGKYTDPDNNSYKVWMDEKMSIPHWDGQAAYFLPPIQNYVNGPTGMVYNPGTALSPQWYDHFFISEFRGSPANSPIHAFKMKTAGASFELDTTLIVIHGALPTGLDWGPEGALYFGDWIDGWGTKDYGRVWKLDTPGGADRPIRKETKNLIQSDFSEKTLEVLSALLEHQDMRIRHKAQFEIVRRKEGLEIFKAALTEGNEQLKRIHAIWGIAQLARDKKTAAENLTQYLEDSDEEIIAQCAKYLGDVKYKGAEKALVSLVNHNSPRVQFFATEALGRIEYSPAFSTILSMLERNNDKDLYLRHAGILALSRIGNAKDLLALKENSSTALRTAAVVALRRMKHPEIEDFLNDQDEYIIAETARAINDDYSIPEALPALAELLKNTESTNEVIIRRSINACVRVGRDSDLTRLVNYALNLEAPDEMREEVIKALSSWTAPSVLDRVDGRYRGEIERDDKQLKAIFSPKLSQLLSEENSEIQKATLDAAAKLNALDLSDQIEKLFINSKSSSIRKSALNSLVKLSPDHLDKIIELGLKDRSYSVRSAALSAISSSDISDKDAVPLFITVLNKENANIREVQAALKGLGSIKEPSSESALLDQFEKLKNGHLKEEVHLDLISAMEEHGTEELKSKLTSHFLDLSSDPLGEYLAALEGGDSRIGRDLFYGHEAAQCVRCHSIYEWGGDAGPGLGDVGQRLDKREILESMVMPSATLSSGYEVVSLALKGNESVAGYVKNENDQIISIEKGNKEYIEVNKSDILERTNIPSSMPDMSRILSKTEIRDLIAFLGGLKIKRES